jgi:LytS/YehU family sensor histidine kinase
MVRLAEGRGITLALLTPPVFWIVQRYSHHHQKPVRYVLACVAGLIPFMTLYACIRWAVVPPWSASQQRYVSRAGHSPFETIQSGFADQILLYLVIILAAHAYEYYERSRKQEKERLEYQQALAASELQALKMQLHPHFLFNTLHGIATLIDADRQRAKLMIVKLSILLRTALENRGSDLISLKQELEFMREYLDLEKMRFGDRLSIVWNVDSSTEQCLVPQLILQPLVENAIRHGIAASREPGWIEVSSRRRNGGDVLFLQVRNSLGTNHPKGTGLGLRNTAARLKYLYANEAKFSLAIGEDRAATTTLELPLLRSNLGQGQGPVELRR